jgi:ornithine cyclodeaminase
LRFPNQQRNRIIALPAYLGGEFETAGIKWVSSFPGNLEKGLDRASAVVILNSAQTGRPEAILEGSIISAKRTAASAALAAQCLHIGNETDRVGLIGCGLINFEIARFLLAVFPEIRSFIVFDTESDRAQRFRDKCLEIFANVDVTVAENSDAILAGSSLVSFATTSSEPYIFDFSRCSPGSTVLHISLRDLAPEVILSCDNIVDDVDHVCRAQTSVHLAEQLVGHREFIRCSVADILSGAKPARKNRDSIAIFSPFGLGILDLAVSKLVRDLGRERGQGSVIESFLPDSWMEEKRGTLV